MQDKPPRTVIDQRVRNRIIEYLELAASYAMQYDYQRSVPQENVPSEVINEWEDWVSGDHLDRYREPVFSIDEQLALQAFHDIWSGVAEDTPDPLPPLDALVGTEPWERLRAAAEAALKVFKTRGRFDEDREEFPH